MSTPRPETIYYKKSRFSSRLPVDRLYSPAHYWVAAQEGDSCRIGFTKFATRMLGDVVEYGFDVKAGDRLGIGQGIGWVEGFKARTDVYCVAAGDFECVNPLLEEDITRIDADPYVSGWLYSVRGKPDADSMDVHGYMALLDSTISRMLEAEAEEAS